MARGSTKNVRRRKGGTRARRAAAYESGGSPFGDGTGRRREFLGVVLLALGLTLILALWSFTPQDRVLLEEGYPATHNLIGPLGHRVGGGLLSLMGLGAFVLAAAVLAGALACFARRRVHITIVEVIGYAVLAVFGAALAHLTMGEMRPFHHAPGGATGAITGELLREWMNTTGAVIVASAVALLALMIASDFTLARVLGGAGRGIWSLLCALGPGLRTSWARAMAAREERRLARETRRREREESREARRRELESRRLEQVARPREEGAIEADDRGLIVAGSDDAEDPKQEEAPTRAEPPPRAETPGGEEDCARARPASPSTVERRDQKDKRRRAHVPEPPDDVLAIAPSNESEPLEEEEPVDPLADPTWADPEWAPGLAALAAAAREQRQGTTGVSSPVGETSLARAAAAGVNPADEREEQAKPEIPIVQRREPPRAQLGERGEEGADGEESPPSLDSEPMPALSKAVEQPADSRTVAEPERATLITPRDEGRLEEPRASAQSEPTIVHPKRPNAPSATCSKDGQESFAYTIHGDKFVLPSLDFMVPPPENPETNLDRDALVETARRLTEKLSDFGIAGEVVQIRPGPVITMYEFRPGPGVKISKIQSLADDLAMAMEALRVRIVAPIPGKNAVGIEVPNATRHTVYAKEILEQPQFSKSKSRLTMALGKGIEGDPVVVDLAKMPHLLIAGTTGSGKSVAVNAMITSMLYKATPDEVRFIMIDPKVLELKLYEGIPHLLLPVVTDPAKAALALRWATDEMDRRYHLLADQNVRDLASFNKKVRRLREDWEKRQEDREELPPLESADGDARAHEELRRLHEEHFLADPPPPEPIPLLVIVIDELADLMMVASRDVETYIARLAQKARASGIHLLVATQRPSTDVLTGVIKINFPARISFRVASRHDSMTIINESGAEKLLGNGDMLMIPPGQSEPLRAHGAFLSEDEIERVVAHLKTQGEPVYDESILQPREEATSAGDDDDDGLDAKWDEAMAIVSERDTISVSWIQRRLAIGYNRAARMIERMEREGIVGPADGSKPREVLLGSPHH